MRPSDCILGAYSPSTIQFPVKRNMWILNKGCFLIHFWVYWIYCISHQWLFLFIDLVMGWTCAWLIQLFKNDGRFVWPSLSGYAEAGDQMKVRPWLELQKYGEVQGTLASWILWAWEVSYASSRGSLVHQGMVYCWWVLNLTSKHLMAQYIQTLNAKLINKRKKKKWLRILTFIFMMQTFASFKRQYLGRAP